MVAVASAQDDGRYHPDNSGAYTHQGVAYNHGSGKYVHTAPQQQVVRQFIQPPQVIVPQQFVQPQYVQPQYVQPQVARAYNNEGHWQILRDSREQSPVGDYVFEYETENGIHAREQAQAIAPQSQKAQGFYEYKSPEGQTIRVDYTADENGFQAAGAHLPVAPPVPEAIARSVEYQLRNARV